jgi:hypothetical protein
MPLRRGKHRPGDTLLLLNFVLPGLRRALAVQIPAPRTEPRPDKALQKLHQVSSPRADGAAGSSVPRVETGGPTANR